MDGHKQMNVTVLHEADENRKLIRAIRRTKSACVGIIFERKSNTLLPSQPYQHNQSYISLFQIAVVLVDGELEHPLKVLKEARRAQVHGIEVSI